MLESAFNPEDSPLSELADSAERIPCRRPTGRPFNRRTAAVGTDWLLRPSDQRFSMEGGAAVLSSAFESVIRFDCPPGHLVVTDVGALDQYVASVEEHYETELEVPWSEVVRRFHELATDAISTDGALRFSAQAGAFVCRLWTRDWFRPRMIPMRVSRYDCRPKGHRSRRVLSTVLILLMAGFGSAVLSSGAVGASTPPSPAGSKTSVRSLTFPGPFIPVQVVSVDGSVWVLGSSGKDPQDSCSIEEINPKTLQHRNYPISLCGYYVAVGNGLIYLAGDVSAINGDELHLEIFNPATKHATVMNPVMITTQGSGRAHMDMTYGAGSIWMSYWGSELVQVSPSTGVVLHEVTNAPSSEGGHGTIVANGAGVWIAADENGEAAISRLAASSHELSRIYTGAAHSSVLWLSSIGTTVWADVASGSDGHPIISTRLIAFDLSGRPILEGPNEMLDDVPLVGSNDLLWSIGSGALCSAPQKLWRIDPATGSSTDITALRTPIEPCLTENPTTSQIAVVNRSVFVLEATGTKRPAAVLYRVRVTMKAGRKSDLRRSFPPALDTGTCPTLNPEIPTGRVNATIPTATRHVTHGADIWSLGPGSKTHNGGH